MTEVRKKLAVLRKEITRKRNTRREEHHAVEDMMKAFELLVLEIDFLEERMKKLESKT